jgi:hypothetical protein
MARRSLSRGSTSDNMTGFIPRVASIDTWPKHKIPTHSFERINQMPSSQALDKELTNNRIKLMNMKSDYERLRKLILKIKG